MAETTYKLPRYQESSEYKSLMDEIASLKAQDAKLRADYRAIVDPLYEQANFLRSQIGSGYGESDKRRKEFEEIAVRELDDLVRRTPDFQTTVRRVEQLRSLIPDLEKFISDAKPGSKIILPTFLTRIPFDPLTYTDRNKSFFEEQLAQAKKDLAGAEASITGPLTHWYVGDIAKAIVGPSRVGGRDTNELAREVIDAVTFQKMKDSESPNSDAALQREIDRIENQVIPSYLPALNQQIDSIDNYINSLYNSIPQRSRAFEARYIAEKRDIPVQEVLKNPVAYKEADYLNEVLDRPFNEALEKDYDKFLNQKLEAEAKEKQQAIDRAEQRAAADARFQQAMSVANVANVQPGIPVKPDTSILPGMTANPGQLAPLRFDEILRQFEATGQLGRPFYSINDLAAADVPLDELARLFYGDKADQVNLVRLPTVLPGQISEIIARGGTLDDVNKLLYGGQSSQAQPAVPKATADQLAKEIALGSNLGQLTFKGEAVPNQTEFLSNYIQNAGLDAVLKDLSDKGVSFGTGYNAPRVDPDIARELSSKVISAMGFDPKTDANVGSYASVIQRFGIDEGLKQIAKANNREVPNFDATGSRYKKGPSGKIIEAGEGDESLGEGETRVTYLDALKKRNEEALGTYQTKQKELFDTNLQNILSGQEVRPTTAAATVLTPRQAVTQAYEQYGLKPEGAGFNSYVDYFTRFGNDVGLAKLNENLSPVARGQTATLFEPQKPFSTDVYGTGAPSFGGAPSSGSGIGAAFGSQYTPGQFVPESFQQQINAPTSPYAPSQLPAYESRPLITQAERPSLDTAVQYIESTRPGEGPMPYMTPQQVGATPVQPASYADLFGYTPYTEYIGQSEYTTPMNANLYAAGYEANIPTRGMKAGGSVAQEARGLAAMGRRGDSMLVHMAPEEVAGLRALAMREGTDLTINPETGLPEANRLKRAFRRYGPMIIGALAAPYLGPLASTLGMSTAATAGLLVGGGTMLGGGSFKQGLMQGLGTYGLSSLAGSMGYQGFGGAAAPAGTPGFGGGPGGSGPGGGPGSASQVSSNYGGVDLSAPDAYVQQDVLSPGDYAPNTIAPSTAPPPAVPSVAAADAAAKPPTFGQKFTEATGFSPSTAIIGGTMLAGLSEGEKERDMYEEERRRQEEEERRRRSLGMEAFVRGNQPVDTRAMYGASGGLVALARGGMTYMEAGGTTGPTGEPRMVAGNGDGMSDSVPATIEGVQEARLANDEFVIPADVVADIGNGSSSAGAKKLYDMMDRIREARHGTTEQPPEISAEQFMPA